MKKYGNTNSDGLCTVKNPYDPYSPNHEPGTDYSEFDWFSKQNPPLPLYTPSGQLVKDAVNVEVEGPVAQFLSDDWTTGKNVQSWVDGNDGDKPFLTYNSYAKYWNERKFETRQIYRLLTVPPTESEPSPMSSKGIKSAEEMLNYQVGLHSYPHLLSLLTRMPRAEQGKFILTCIEAYHAQFATVAGGNNKLLLRCQEILMDTVGFNHIPNDISQSINELISLIDNALKAPSNNSSSEMVQVINRVVNYVKSDLDHPDKIQREESEKLYIELCKLSIAIG